MFLFQETYYATAGLQDLVNQRVQSLHQAQATQPSSIASDWAKYLGDGVTYLALRHWNDRHYQVDEEHMRWMGEYNRTRPADLFSQSPDIEFFEPVSQFGQAGGAGFLVRTELEVGGRYTSDWASWEQELRTEMAGAPGFREWRLYQFLGRESRYFRCEFWETQVAGQDFWQAPARRKLVTSLPAETWRRPPRPAYYQVLLQLGHVKLD